MHTVLTRHIFFGLIAAFFLFTMPHDAFAERLFSSGCEFQSDAPGNMVRTFEFWDVGSSTPSTTQISTTIKRSGNSSCKSTQAVAGWSLWRHYYRSLPTYGPVFFRFYFYIETAPAHDASIASIGSNGQTLILNADRTLKLLDANGTTVLATYGTPLATGQWHRLEWNVNTTGPTTGDAEIKLNGSSVMTAGPTINMITHGTIQLGMCFTSFTSICNSNAKTTGTIYFDDIAVNDGTGSAQNSWPGPGSIVLLRPNAAGDVNGCVSGNYLSVDEITPDGSSTVCVLDDVDDTLEVNVQSGSSAGIGGSQFVKVVQVGIQEAAAAGGMELWQVRVKSASGATPLAGFLGGPTSVQNFTTHDDLEYKINGDNTPRAYQVVSYLDPTTGSPWTLTGTNSIDNMQIGVTALDASPDIKVSALWALVEYDSTPPPWIATGRLWSSGCEFQGNAPGDMISGLEFDTMGWTFNNKVVTTVKRSGLSACGASPTTGGISVMQHQFATNSLASYFFRFYVYIQQAPTGGNLDIAYLTNVGPADFEQSIMLTSARTLKLLGDAHTELDSDTTVLNTGQWYRIEWQYKGDGSTSSVRLDGIEVLSASGHDGDAVAKFAIGACGETSGVPCSAANATTTILYFDDIAINEATGAYQNSWPGAGSIVHMQPDSSSGSGSGSGNDCSSGDWNNVKEITPDDGTTKCTLSGNDKAIRVGLESSSNAGIPVSSTISLVHIGVREGAAGAGSESWVAQYRPDTNAMLSGPTKTRTDTAYLSNASEYGGNYSYTAYISPLTGLAWTLSGLNNLDLGLTTIDGSPAVNLSTLWALVEYNPPPPPSVSISASASPINPSEPSTLTWSSSGATTCVASGGWSGSKSLSANEIVYPAVTTMYTITCTGAGGDTSASVTVSVNATPFMEPSGGPHAGRTNAGKYLNIGSDFQEKGASAGGAAGGGFGADFITAISTLCLGSSNCISDWWPTLARPTTCKLEVHRVRGGSTTFGSVLKTSGCDARLSLPAKASGWVATGMDYCDDGLCGASTVAGCVYTRMVCTGGVTMYTPPLTTIQAHPVSTFTFTPQCNDGLDNDSLSGIDYPADPQCSTFWDNDESS